MRHAILAFLSLVLFAAATETSFCIPDAPNRPIMLVLFHGCQDGASSRDWTPLTDALPPGFAVVAPELPRIEAEGDNTAWMAAWRRHGTAAVDEAFRRARSEHPGAFVVAGGAGCGGFFALIGVERHDVDAFFTLSGLSDEAQRECLEARRIAVLGIASREDGEVPARVDRIVRSGGPGSLLQLYPGRAHGTAILIGAPARSGEIVDWIRARTKPPA